MATSVKYPTPEDVEQFPDLRDDPDKLPPVETPAEKKTRAPALKRPDGLSDTEWAIMKAARNEDIVPRINAIRSGATTPTPEEAAVIMEVVVGVEAAAYREIKKLRESLAPKIEANAVLAESLHHIKMVMFRIATGRE